MDYNKGEDQEEEAQESDILTTDTIPIEPVKEKRTRQGGWRSDKKPNNGECDIPAKEIKLAKILMDKPAPHCSA